VDGLQAIYNKVHASKLNKEEVLSRISQDKQTSGLVAAYQLNASDGVKTAEAISGKTEQASALPQPRNNTISDAQARAIFRMWKPLAADVQLGEKAVSGVFAVDIGALESYKKDVLERAKKLDPAAEAEAANEGRVLAALQSRGCSLSSNKNDTNGCGVLRGGVQAWIATNRFGQSSDAANFESRVITDGLGHDQPELVQRGNLNVLTAAVQQGPEYWAQEPELDNCYQGAVN